MLHTLRCCAVVCCVCCREEGFLAFWKGNGVNIIRIFPYSAAQLAANDSYKRVLAGLWGEGGHRGKWAGTTDV